MNLNDYVKNNLEDIIDIREIDEVEMNSIPGVRNVPMMGLLMNPDQFMEKGKTYYIMCLSGGRASNAVSQLTSQGYDVVNIGGIMSYDPNY